jgi:hypothetical protein
LGAWILVAIAIGASSGMHGNSALREGTANRKYEKPNTDEQPFEEVTNHSDFIVDTEERQPVGLDHV